MSRTSKSPLNTAKAAYDAGQKALPRYAHKYSRHDFTCPQLFAILVLRKFFKTDYRGVGPRPDVDELRPLTESMATHVLFDQLLLDAGYDSGKIKGVSPRKGDILLFGGGGSKSSMSLFRGSSKAPTTRSKPCNAKPTASATPRSSA